MDVEDQGGERKGLRDGMGMHVKGTQPTRPGKPTALKTSRLVREVDVETPIISLA